MLVSRVGAWYTHLRSPDRTRATKTPVGRVFLFKGDAAMAAKVQGTKSRRAAQIQQDEVLTTVKGLNLEGVSRSITETQVEVQKVLADLSARVMERLQELQNVEEA